MIREPEDLPELIADMPRGRALSALQILADSMTTVVLAEHPRLLGAPVSGAVVL
jgi:hypothetical protein